MNLMESSDFHAIMDAMSHLGREVIGECRAQGSATVTKQQAKADIGAILRRGVSVGVLREDLDESLLASALYAAMLGVAVGVPDDSPSPWPSVWALEVSALMKQARRTA